MNEKLHDLWEILVPALDPGGREIDLETHREWDEKVRSISKGLTIMSIAKGQWISPKGMPTFEPMIPVRFVATDEEAREIARFTQDFYYHQLEIMFYKISDEVYIIS